MTTLTVTRAKEQFLKIVRQTHDSGERFIITNKGEPYAILMSNDEYEGLLETLDIMSDKRGSKELLESMKQAERGETVSFEEVVGRKQKK